MYIEEEMKELWEDFDNLETKVSKLMVEVKHLRKIIEESLDKECCRNQEPTEEVKEEKQEEEPTEVAITLDQMKRAARTVSEKLGGAQSVKAAIAKFAEGGDKLTNVPPKKYATLLEKFDQLIEEATDGTPF
jgi:hypothetical protein